MSLDSKRTARPVSLTFLRYALLALLLISAGTASAQWLPNPYSSGPIYFTGGSVGIGTTDTSLQNGDVGLVISGDGPSIRLTTTELVSRHPWDPPACGDYELGTTPGGFAIFDGCALVPRLTVAPDGSVTLGALNADSVSVPNVYAQFLTLETGASDLLRVNDSRSWAAGRGGSITFGGHITSQTESQDLARIAGIKENGTDFDHSSALLFFTRPNATDLTERMRIGSDGLVTIGPAGNTTLKLAVNGLVQSASGGFKFPDGTIQTTASSGGGSSQWTNGTSGAIYYSSGNVGLGTSSPQSAFHISRAVATSTDYLFRLDNAASANNPAMRMTYVSGKSLLSLAGTNGGALASDGSLWFATGSNLDANNPSNVRMSVASNGNVGIGLGTTVATHAFDVSGTPIANGSASELLGLYDARSFAAGVGGGIVFGGKYNTAGTPTQSFAAIQGIKENATDGDYASAMLFLTRQNGATPAERMRIGSDGLVTIGPAGNTTLKLAVNGLVQSVSGGFKFPDGTTQTTASASGPWALGTAGAVYYSSGNVGVGTTTPASPLTVAGLVQSTSGGFKFPDGTVQTTASSGGSSQWASGTPAGSIFYSAGNIGIGTAAPETQLHIAGESTSTPRGLLVQQSSAGVNSPFMILRKSRGTILAPGAVLNGDGLGAIYSEAYDGTGFIRTGASIKFSANGTVATGSVPSDIVFNTGSSGLGAEFMRITSAGNVGIGTSSPASPLTVNGVVQSAAGGFKFPDGTVQTTAAAAGGSSQWTSGTAGSIYYASGNVGIGAATNPPPHKVTVTAGHIAVDNGWQLIGRNSTNAFYSRLIGNDNADRILLGDTTSSVANEIRFHTNGSTTPAVVMATSGNVLIGTGATAPSALLEVSKPSTDATLRQEVARLSRTGGVASGATPLRSALLSFYDSNNGTLTAGVAGYRANASGDYNGGLQFFVNNTGAANATNVSQLTEAMRIDSTGHVAIGVPVPAGTQRALEVAGDIHASGNISGGTVYATYQDVAEWVPASGALPAGTVVVLSRVETNHVLPSSTAYDTAVAGVVSEKPGLLLGKGNADEAKIATTGRVKVRVDASRHPIARGDLLVTSDKPGVAMFSEPVELNGIRMHRPGTIIGKALEPLPSGEGEILVLLSLQ